MVKKTVGSIIVASALIVGVAGSASAAQWDFSKIKQEQSATGGWKSIFQYSSKKVDNDEGRAGNSQGQASTSSSFQVQTGKTNGPAEATQSAEIDINVGQTNDDQGQSTVGSADSEQSTSVSDSAHVLQSQHRSVSTFQFQSSIEGGASVQNNVTHDHNYQFSTTVSD